MKVELLLQDPSSENVTYAIDAIACAAEGAKYGQAIFAFATIAGTSLFLEHDSVRALMRRGSLDLIVGIDAITNRPTLERLREAARCYRSFRPKVFWNFSGGLFHPKLCRFWGDRRETWIVGSGNLTPRGLRDSYEMFSVIEGPPSHMLHLRRPFEAFLADHSGDIRDIDEAALVRAGKNKPNQPVRDIEPSESRLVGRRDKTADLGRESHRVLIAELPKGGARWQQANFDGSTATSFFGIGPSHSSRRKELFFTNVGTSGTTAIEEPPRRFTFTKSRNLRVQLAARNGEAYPDGGRPIAAFRTITPRRFTYQLLLPGDVGFKTLCRLLAKHETGTIRRHITTVDVIRKVWPSSPLLLSPA